MGGADSSEGRLEVCINNAWGSVCDERFGAPDTRKVCSLLGAFDLDGKPGCMALLLIEVSWTVVIHISMYCSDSMYCSNTH